MHAHRDGEAPPAASPETMLTTPAATAAPAHAIERCRCATLPRTIAATSPAIGADHATDGPAAPIRVIVPSPNLNMLNVASTGLAPTAHASVTASSLRLPAINTQAAPPTSNVTGTSVSAAMPHAARINPTAAIVAIRGDAQRRFCASVVVAPSKPPMTRQTGQGSAIVAPAAMPTVTARPGTRWAITRAVVGAQRRTCSASAAMDTRAVKRPVKRRPCGICCQRLATTTTAATSNRLDPVMASQAATGRVARVGSSGGRHVGGGKGGGPHELADGSSDALMVSLIAPSSTPAAAVDIRRIPHL